MYVRKFTIVLWALLTVFLIVLSFFIGQLTATVGNMNSVPQDREQIVSNVVVSENRHTAKAAYEAGWNACMRCWGITSTEGLDFENATCLYETNHKTIVLFAGGEAYDTVEVLISTLYRDQELDSDTAKKVFNTGFNDCMHKWSISYANSSRKHIDDITYGFNSWY